MIMLCYWLWMHSHWLWRPLACILYRISVFLCFICTAVTGNGSFQSLQTRFVGAGVATALRLHHCPSPPSSGLVCCFVLLVPQMSKLMLCSATRRSESVSPKPEARNHSLKFPSYFSSSKSSISVPRARERERQREREREREETTVLRFPGCHAYLPCVICFGQSIKPPPRARGPPRSRR